MTPVFNGSASLRNAAGQLIEETVKSVRRKEVVNDKYFDELFREMESLYRLDQTGGVGGGGKKELSPLPIESKVLLTSLALIWVLIAAYVIGEKVKSKKKY